MGITITATNSKYSFDMGYGGYFNLCKNIALCLDKEFGENYAEIIKCHSETDYEENSQKAEEIINKKHLDDKYKDIIDFLYMNDTEGKISHKTCKQIYDLIKDVDFEKKIFRYVVHAHNDYEEFKCFLKECYSKHRKLRWY